MEKHLLVTVSDDLRILHGVRFVGSFFRNKSNVKVTLFYVAPLGELSGGDKTLREINKKNVEVYQKKGQTAIEESTRLLTERGFPPENISSKLMFKQFGKVKDIIREARAKLYDSVVLGGRGYDILANVMKESVSREMLERDIDFPLWICRRPEENRNNVLLCVDGSEPCYRIADHVGFILRNEKEHRVTIFHLDTGKRNTEAMLAETKNKLLQNGIEPERISTRVLRTSGIVSNIVKEVERHAYAVVAVGRVGVKKSLLEGWRVGSTSMKLLENLEKASLWVSK